MRHLSTRSFRLLASTAGLATAISTFSTVAAPVAAHAITTGVITSAGPLTTIGVTPDLNCFTRRLGDTDGEWFDGTATSTNGDDACGTFAVVNGQLYGPASVPAGSSATGPETAPWTPVSQSAVTGSGTTASPFVLVTAVAAGATGVTVTETDTYVTGHEGYSTYISATNNTGAAVNVTLYHAGDCFLQDSDAGYGVVDASTGSAGCQAEVTPEATPGVHVRSTRVEQLFPLTPGSAYMEGFYSSVWGVIGSKAMFTNTCDCADTNFQDNGVGVSWNIPALAPSTTVQEGVYTSLSPTGIVPATTGNVADAASVISGQSDGYTVTVRNTGAAAIHLVGVNDLLPTGFTYTPGSTTGLTTTNPTISGQSLSWTIPSTVVAAHGSATLHFNFTATAPAGDYINSASGVSTETAVVPAGPFAPLHVITVPAAPTSVTTLGTRKAVTVGWVAPTYIGNSAITAYDVQVTPAGHAPTLTTVAALSAVISHLSDNVGYTFQVRADNAAGQGAWSAPVAVGGTLIAVHKLVPVVTYGGSRSMAVTVTSGGQPLVGAKVKLLARAASKHSWSLLTTVTTKAGGKATVKVKPARGSVYEWVYAGDAGHTGSIADKAIAVAPALKISISGKGKAFRGAIATLTGKIAPVFAKQVVVLQRKSGKRWVNVTSAKITKSGSYAFALNTNTRGTWTYRVVKGHSGDYVTAYSATKSLKVS